MRKSRSNRVSQALEILSRRITQWAGSSWAFGIAVAIVVVWLLSGPVFGYSDTWQLVINTGTTVVTFLMVFLIQRSQNKDSVAVHIKLNEIVAALEGASNHLIDVEDLSEKEMSVLHEHFKKLAEMAKTDSSITMSHSIEEAQERHLYKVKTAAHRHSHKRPKG